MLYFWIHGQIVGSDVTMQADFNLGNKVMTIINVEKYKVSLS